MFGFGFGNKKRIRELEAINDGLRVRLYKSEQVIKDCRMGITTSINALTAYKGANIPSKAIRQKGDETISSLGALLRHIDNQEHS